jgi:hypothetical protein
MEGDEGCGCITTSREKAIYYEGNLNVDNT